MKRFEYWMQDRMARAGIASYAELGRRLGVSQPTVNRWAKLHNIPDYDRLGELAKELNVSRLELYQAMGLFPRIPDADLVVIADLWDRASQGVRTRIVEFARFLIRERPETAGEPEESLEPPATKGR